MPSDIEYKEGLQNLEKCNWDVDVVVTHMCPSSILKILKESIKTEVEDDELSKYLEQIKQQLSYNRWFFGHFHQDMELPNNQKLIYKTVERLY
jgi:hypothetical protein